MDLDLEFISLLQFTIFVNDYPMRNGDNGGTPKNNQQDVIPHGFFFEVFYASPYLIPPPIFNFEGAWA